MAILSDSEIIDSWQINAGAWIQAIANEEIESRILVTNTAIINRILAHKPQSLLDIGCGEGWLSKTIAEKNIDVLGIDIVPTFIEYANQESKAQFAVCSYENLPTYQFRQLFDCIVCNFSLLGKESTAIVIATSKNLLTESGRLIIQTLHPVVACGDLPYKDGWRPGSWAGFSKEFTKPAPWYFRTIESWLRLFNLNGFKQNNIFEPLHPTTGKPASIIFECQARKGS
jgi:2-polyprenyl-3-methyl-5-hydroxy-6-metoxy-1,4-benzoquinol methylase